MVHLGVLGLLYYRMRTDFLISQTVATIVAITFNFLLKNVVSFRDRRLRRWQLIIGLFTFYLACSPGALINLSFADLLFRSQIPWYLAGISSMAISSAWNSGVNIVFTWHRGRVRA